MRNIAPLGYIVFLYRNFFFCVIVLLFAVTSAADAASSNHRAKQLVSLLGEMQEREKIVPDSFFSDVRLLRAYIAQETDSVAKSVYRAALAHLLVLNVNRSQARSHGTVSHPDSILEWSHEDYFQHAARLYSQSMVHKEQLHQTPARDWLPLLVKGTDDIVFAEDMLSVIWHAIEGDLSYTQRKKEHLPDYDDLISFYRSKGLREAELLLVLDSLYATTSDPVRHHQTLLGLRERFKEIPACAWVYLRLSECECPPYPADAPSSSKRKEEQLRWLTEGLRLYPSFKKRAMLENRARFIQRPQLHAGLNSMYYPHAKVSTPLQVTNMQRMSFRIYQLPRHFKLQGELATHLSQVQKNGRLLKTIRHHFEERKATEEWTDTLHWNAPDVGFYAAVLEGDTKAELSGKVISEVALFEVTSLACIYSFLPEKGLRVIAVDALSGEPQENVSVELFAVRNGAEEKLAEQLTATDGRVETPLNGRLYNGSYKVRLSRGTDDVSTTYPVSGAYNLLSAAKDSIQQLQVCTDRAIYRPGQKVYVAAVAYKQKDWGARVMSGRKFTLMFYDANRQLLKKKELVADEYGVMADTLQLPEHGLPGEYMVRLGSQVSWVRVEEYKRPTFRVELDDVPSFRWNTDSVTFTGRALTYSGVPVRRARVTSIVSWRGSSWWRNYYDTTSPERLDTVWTDSEGRFSLRVPVKREAEQMKRGQWLSLMVDVLSRQNETQQGEAQVHFCSEPLRLFGQIPLQQQKERPKPWRFDLLSSVEKPVLAPVQCTLSSGSGEYCFVVPSGVSRVPEILETLPSGKYILHARALAGTDSAHFETSVLLFSEKDARLAFDTALWVCAVSDTFAVGRPAKVQMGTALNHGWLNCLLVSENNVLLDSTLHLQDSVCLWDIPYKKEYGHGARLLVSLFHNGEMHSQSLPLVVKQPDMRLRMQWDVFRNLTCPGAVEEWKLTLHRPDGTPAQANVLMSLYDASLDALARHRLSLSVRASHRIPSIWERATNGFSGHHNVASLLMNVRQQKANGYAFAQLDNDLFPTLALEEVAVGGKLLRFSANASRSKLSVPATGMGQMSADATETSAAEAETETASPVPQASDKVALRGNMQEQAFFMPRLRTDAKGLVALSFTLPESMTSWHLTGFAHTADMLAVDIDETVMAQKELMAELHQPRYLRMGDKTALTASVRNLTSQTQTGTATCLLCDAQTDKVLRSFDFHFEIPAQSDTTYSIMVETEGLPSLLALQWSASSVTFSDGERRLLPLLSDVQTFTETKTFTLEGPQTLQADLNKSLPSSVNGTQLRSLTLEYTSHPAWLAVQSLPSLTSPERKDVLSLASAYYAGALAHYMAGQNEVLREALHRFAQEPVSVSTLEGNQELAGLLLHETPWVMPAYEEKRRRQNVVSLLQAETCLSRAMEHLSALKQLQHFDGSFAWYPGMQGSAYLTGEVAVLLTRLQRMTKDAVSDASVVVAGELLDRAASYMKNKVHDEVERAKEKDVSYRLSRLAMQYLYVMAEKRIPTGDAQKDVAFLTAHLQRYAKEYQKESRAFVAMLLHLYGKNGQALELLPELRKLLKHHDGFYLSYPSGSFVGIDQKIQSHVLFMETFRLLTPQDTELMRSMQQWLLKQKRTQDWEQPLQTANAVYALLADGYADLGKEYRDELKTYRKGKVTILAPQQESLGTLRQRYEPYALPDRLKITKRSTGMSWGAVYLQYTAPIKGLQSKHEGLSIRRESPAGKVRVGDRLSIRYVITADRDYEFVRLQLPRISGAEPETQLSGYVWQNGLGYYRTVHDTGTECYIDSLPRGTYVLEEEWLLAADGTFQWAPALLQCLYAPEYQARTSAQTIELKEP